GARSENELGFRAPASGHPQQAPACPRKFRRPVSGEQHRIPIHSTPVLSAVGLGRWRSPRGLEVRRRWILILLVPLLLLARREPALHFQSSDRCIACHNGLSTPSGEDISIGFDWRPSMMANSSRDPYWQASVRRESIDHPESRAAIEDECSICHMPMARYESKLNGREGEV